ncbi:ribonuclease T2 [Phreatobacter sp. AB_2022a]|uniref:ribonuclease T2 n=1 Tax=Phreatobacter sp. AB_2022a TaxID=3003134 RepID=UPI00228715D8|nr:ribonuclease T2 [Phreatobacter sp. AB_2022a]MCZ0737395.1 ribonuclease T2 [Phreatobacter sp. AB_2022a]
MSIAVFRRLGALAFAGVLAASAGIGTALGQARHGATPGEFDFYVLALSWSPSFCEAQGERSSRSMQCAGDRPFSFVVHGLWPQFTRGFPEYCQVPAPELDRRIVNGMLDIMPAPGLVRQQWAKHGTCSGARSPGAYFETVRQARAKIRIPQEFEAISEIRTVSPDEVEDAFVRANPGLQRDMISVQCDAHRLREVRICIGRDMNFSACEEAERRSCRRERLAMPPVRPGRS